MMLQLLDRAFPRKINSTGAEDSRGGQRPQPISRSAAGGADPYLKKLWKESFKEFYKKYSRALWFYIYKTCGDESMADDVFQETFYRYLRAEPVRLNEYQQKAYLYKVAYRLIIDQKRKQKTEREKPSEAGFEIKIEESKEKEIYMALDMEKTFKLLKPAERHLLWLAYVEDYSHKEIADITGAKEKSIKVQLFRVNKKFAAVLKQKGYSGEVSQ